MAPMTHQWKKILYAPQPHEDNYVDKTFLEQLRTNAHVQEHDYGGMVRSAAAIIQQISAILIFYSMFEFVRQDFVSTVFLGVIDVTLAVTGFAVLRTHLEVPLCTWDTINACLLFCATLSLLSPVLRTLTKSYADDTIWVLATFLGMLHLLTHDYNYVNSGIGRFSGTISLNAAIFTAVLLGSRLQSNEHVFAFVLLAIEVFAIFPIFQREVKRYSERLHLITTAMILFLALTLTWQISGLLSVLTGAFVIFLAFVCPLWFMHVQESKRYLMSFSLYLNQKISAMMRILRLTHEIIWTFCVPFAVRFLDLGTSLTSNPSSSTAGLTRSDRLSANTGITDCQVLKC